MRAAVSPAHAAAARLARASACHSGPLDGGRLFRGSAKNSVVLRLHGEAFFRLLRRGSTGLIRPAKRTSAALAAAVQGAAVTGLPASFRLNAAAMISAAFSPAGVVAIVAPLVAIIGGLLTISSRQRSPSLSLDYSGPPRDATTVQVDYLPEPGRTVPSHWLRVRVANKGGRRRKSANHVEVRLNEVARLLDRWREMVPVDSSALIWSNQPQESGSITIAPGAERRADVAVLRWPPGAKAMPIDGSGGCWAELRVLPVPSSDRHHLQAGRYLLDMVLTGEDISAKRYQAVLLVSGVWRDGFAVWDADFLLGDVKRHRWWRKRPS